MFEKAIHIEGVSYVYHDSKLKTEALKDLNFSLEYGKISGILGPNGSGKSTSFKLLSTQIKAQSGKVFVGGVSVIEDPKAIRRLIGVTFQSPSLDPQLSVLENLDIHAALIGLSSSGADAKIRENLEALGLSDKRDVRVKNLSGGLARRAELAKTMLADPKVLLLDEPTTGLDPKARHEIWNLLKKFMRPDRAIVVTTHLMEEAELCDELVFMSEGHVVAQGSPEALKRSFGKSVVMLSSQDLDSLTEKVSHELEHIGVRESSDLKQINGRLRLEVAQMEDLWPRFQPLMGHEIDALEWSQGTLADVYWQKTGKELKN